MDHSCIKLPSVVPDMSRHEARERLEDEISELAAHINAANYDLLVLIGRYDAEKGWGQHGLASCAHWLQWRCGTNLGVAREKVRVARALPGLAKISAAFREGRVSYSKVRAMTRIAKPENEDCLLMVARYGTAQHIEKMVRNYRRCERQKLLQEECRNHALRELSWHIDEDGDHVAAETSRRMACDASVVKWREDEDGEPLSIGRKSRTIPPAIRRALHRRDGGCRFPGCSCHRFVDAHHIVHWADGGETSMDNLVLLCRRHHRLVHEGGFGVHVGAGSEIWFSYPSGDTLPATADGRCRGNAELIRVVSAGKDLEITPRTLPPEPDEGPMDYNYAQQLLEQYDRAGR